MCSVHSFAHFLHGEDTMPRLTQAHRDQIIGMLRAGRNQSATAREYGVSQSTVSRLAARYRETGSTRDRPRSGRPRETSPHQDRHIVLGHLRNRFLTAAETAGVTEGRHDPHISNQIMTVLFHYLLSLL
jgi:transposase